MFRLMLSALFALVPLFCQTRFEVVGDWAVRVSAQGIESQTITVVPAQLREVTSERISALPLFNPKAGGWAKGVALAGVKAQEASSPGLLDPNSFELRRADGAPLRRGIDYEVDLLWGTLGRLPEGSLAAEDAVVASYRHAQMRLDAVVAGADGRVHILRGEGRAAAPVVPSLSPGQRHLGNVYLPSLVPRLAPEHLFPILETALPRLPVLPTPTVERIRKKLERGDRIRILAWGDSVTDAAYLTDPQDRWQEQFVRRLRERFPKAQIELATEAWGGRNTGSYLAQPPGSEHNYKEKVLGAKPDLIISEFVNDAGLNPAQVEERYSKLLADFQSIGAEWVILTPHYVRPDWMGLTRENDVDEDPRPYVAGLRAFAGRHDVGLADASRRYGRLWRQGIPYNALMLNAINHPDPRGMKLFADALLALWEKTE